VKILKCKGSGLRTSDGLPILSVLGMAEDSFKKLFNFFIDYQLFTKAR